MQNVKKILKWTGVVILTMLVLLLVINAFDEKIAPEVAALISAPPASVPQGENAYFVFFGFRAPPGRTCMPAGSRWSLNTKKSFKLIQTVRPSRFPMPCWVRSAFNLSAAIKTCAAILPNLTNARHTTLAGVRIRPAFLPTINSWWTAISSWPGIHISRKRCRLSLQPLWCAFPRCGQRTSFFGKDSDVREKR